MRLAISNIAWDVAEDEQVVQLLNKHAVDAIDIAPAKYFPDPINTSVEKIDDVRFWWADRGIEITGMQALLFGTEGLNIFGSQTIQSELLKYLQAICKIASALGSSRLSFGSPKNRDRSGMDDTEAMAVAEIFFRQLGDIAESYGVWFCLEPVLPCFGANFMTTTEAAAKMVEQVNHSAIKLQLDSGAMTANGENMETIIKNYTPLIGHVHASEPDLVPLGDANADHQLMYELLSKHLPNHVVTVEMLATTKEQHSISIERALANAVRCYRPEISGANT